MKYEAQYIDIEIDKLTHSIENSITGDSFQTEVIIADKDDIKKITKVNVDFFVNPKPLSKTKRKMISDYIKADKEKRKRLKTSKVQE